MKKFLIGHSPITTIAGFIISALTAITQAGSQGAHNWKDYIIPAAIAIFGRLAGDDANNKSQALLPLKASRLNKIRSRSLPKPAAAGSRLRSSRRGR